MNIIQILLGRDLLETILNQISLEDIQQKLKGGMLSDAKEGGPSHLEANPILFPSIPTLDVLSKPIIDPDDPSYILSPKSHDEPRNPQRHPKHRSHEGHKEF